eukprot:6181324-Pleurochrysis_carterae.AAC.1
MCARTGIRVHARCSCASARGTLVLDACKQTHQRVPAYVPTLAYTCAHIQSTRATSSSRARRRRRTTRCWPTRSRTSKWTPPRSVHAPVSYTHLTLPTILLV